MGAIAWDGGVDDSNEGVVTLHRWGEEPQVVTPLAGQPVGRDAMLGVVPDGGQNRRPPETGVHDNIHSLALAESIDRGELVCIKESLAG